MSSGAEASTDPDRSAGAIAAGDLRLRRHARCMLVAAAYLGLALVLTSIWFNSGSRFNSYARAEFVDLIEGTGYRPFVHRLLVPAVVRGARALVGEGTRERLIDAHPVFLELGTRYEFEDPSYGFELVLCFAVWYLAMAGFLFGMRAVARALYERPGSTADLVPLVAAFSLPMFFAEGAHYLYDPTDLALSTWCIYAIASGRTRLFYVVFAAALLNKETAAVFVALFALARFGRETPGRLGAHLVAQCALVAALLVLTHVLFGENPGGVVERRLAANLRELAAAGFLLSPERVAALALFACLLFARFESRPAFLRIGLVVPAILAPLYVAGGVWGEIRVFLPAYPILAMLAGETLFAIAGRPLIAARAAQPPLLVPELSWLVFVVQAFVIVLGAVSLTLLLQQLP